MDSNHINYVDHNSILIVNPSGKMRQLFVPFRAQVIQETSIMVKNTWVLVDEVQPNTEYKMLYRIATLWWPYYIFRLSVAF